MTTRNLVLALAGVAALTTACGGSSTPSTGALFTPGASATPRPARNLVKGELVQVKGAVVTLTARDGTDLDFDMAPNAIVSQEQDAAITDVAVGSCAFGFGQRLAPDLVAATQVIIGAQGPKGAGDCRRGGGGRVGRTGLAGGEVTAVNGQTYTVNSIAGPQQFKVNLNTKFTRLVTVEASTLSAGQCITATGRRSLSGTLTASRVVISPPNVNGCFTSTTGSGSNTGGG